MRIIVLSGRISGATIEVTGTLEEGEAVTVTKIIHNASDLPLLVGEKIILGEPVAGIGPEPMFKLVIEPALV